MNLKPILAGAVCALALAGAAQAHITLRNEANSIESLSGKSDTFRLVVPVVRSADLVSVRLVMADGVKFLFIENVAGWTYELKRNEAGLVQEVLYAGRAKPGEVVRFPFIALNPAKADAMLAYKAYAGYADQVTMPFDGSDEAKGYQPRILLK